MLADSNDPIVLKEGTSTNIRLKGLATAGYTWSYTIDGDKECITVSKEFVHPGKSAEKILGHSADEVFTITAQKKGTANVHFCQERAWEKNAAPVDEKTAKIIVE